MNVPSTTLLDKLAFELARQYAAGWNQCDSDQPGAHLVSVAKQKRRARVWARANAQHFMKEAQQFLSNPAVEGRREPTTDTNKG